MSDRPRQTPPPPPTIRRGTRCPICDGPTWSDPRGRERCRNSLCVYNHRDAKCPRCASQALKSAWFAEGEYHYSCAKCQNAWQEPA